MRNRRRSGYALIELMIVMTVTLVMLTLCAGIIHLLLKLDHSGRTASDESADMARLAHDFRADIHASSKAEPVDKPADRLTLSIDAGRTVEYQVRPRDILRTAREGENVRRFEIYRRPPRTTISFEVGKDNPRPFATVIVDRPVDGRDDAFYRDYRIEAEIGKDLRLNPRVE